MIKNLSDILSIITLIVMSLFSLTFIRTSKDLKANTASNTMSSIWQLFKEYDDNEEE